MLYIIMHIRTFQSDDEIRVNLHKKDVFQYMFKNVELPNPPENKISKEKFDDLISLLNYITQLL